jgi:hypothetical protein
MHIYTSNILIIIYISFAFFPISYLDLDLDLGNLKSLSFVVCCICGLLVNICCEQKIN